MGRGVDRGPARGPRRRRPRAFSCWPSGEEQPGALDVVAGPLSFGRRARAGWPPRGRAAPRPRCSGSRVAAVGVEQGPAAMERGPDGGIGGPLDRPAERARRLVELPLPLVQLGQGRMGLVRPRPEPDRRLEVGERLGGAGRPGGTCRPGSPAARSGSRRSAGVEGGGVVGLGGLECRSACFRSADLLGGVPRIDPARVPGSLARRGPGRAAGRAPPGRDGS